MFELSRDEINFLIFLFIIKTYEKPEQLFDSNLKCKEFSGRKYLCNILNINQNTLSSILNGPLKEIGVLDYYKSEFDLDHDFLPWFQNPSKELLTKKLFSECTPESLAIEDFFIKKDKKNYILRLLKDKPASSTHILLYGPPGSGKTSFARCIAAKIGIQSYEILGSEENKSINRQTAVKACLNMTNKGSGSLIIIDEADNLLNTQMSWFMRGETQDKGWLNQLLDEPGSRVIWITNHINNIEDSVLRRFSYSACFPSFNRVQRTRLWENILTKNQCHDLITRNEIKTLWSKYDVSAGAISIAVKKAVESGCKNKKKFLTAVEMAIKAHQILMNSGDSPDNGTIIDEDYSLNGLNMDVDIQKMMKQLKIFDHYLRSSAKKNIVNMNLLFFGPPGTGKSELAKYIANRLDRPTICKRISDIQSKWVGESERNIKDAFKQAEQKEAILIIDEADTLLFNRERAQHSWEISCTNEFLTQMEQFKGILICTTNRLSDLDTASTRRFNHKIKFRYLDAEGNVVFYKKMICPLLKARLNQTQKKLIMNLKHLTPGDFKTVRNNYSFYPSKELDHKGMILALFDETKYKKTSIVNKSIGF